MKHWWILVGLLFAGLSPMASAHHAYAGFDTSRLTYTGVVRDFEWTNPHIWIRLIVTEPDGQKTEWGIEAAAPVVAKRMGFKASSLKPGDQVTMVFHPRTDGSKIGSFISAKLPDGSMIKGRDADGNNPDADRSTSGLAPKAPVPVPDK